MWLETKEGVDWWLKEGDLKFQDIKKETEDWVERNIKKVFTEQEIYKRLGIDYNVARRTIDHSPSKIDWAFELDNLPEGLNVDAHWLNKGRELYYLLLFLNNWIKYQMLYTAPLTPWNTSQTVYKDWLFIIASEPWKQLLRDGIKTVLINEMYGEEWKQIAIKLKNILQESYPHIDFILYSEARDYYLAGEKHKVK